MAARAWKEQVPPEVLRAFSLLLVLLLVQALLFLLFLLLMHRGIGQGALERKAGFAAGTALRAPSAGTIVLEIVPRSSYLAQDAQTMELFLAVCGEKVECTHRYMCLCVHTDTCVCVYTQTHVSVCTHRHMCTSVRPSVRRT